MNDDPCAFAACFERMTDFAPMRWQRRLFDEFVAGRIPPALDLPTGLGKTSTIAIWLLARAFAPDDVRGKIPRRLVYVVDRRAVVDQATEEAIKLQTKLEGAPDLKRRLGLDGKLPISTLRGAFRDNREWLEDPSAPAIVVGTVDMIGSRLLFSGYGVSRKMRPYHAGLLGVDALVVLDEAHLVPPFEALVDAIAGDKNLVSPAPAASVAPLRLLSLSATGRSRPAPADAEPFRLDDDDLQDDLVRKRLSAKKTVELVSLDAKETLALALAGRALRFIEKGGGVRCVVYCDSRDVAEKAKAEIQRQVAPSRKSPEPKADVELLVGARRVHERDAVRGWLFAQGFLAGSPRSQRPAILVATSAGEVGVDLDADHMVCDLAAWERMVQRFGRVNRRGDGDAGIVVVHGDEPKSKKPAEPTDQELRAALAFRALAVLRALPDGDASPGALRDLARRTLDDAPLREAIAAATTPEPLRPQMTRALAEAWAMTSLDAHPGRPQVAPWLRGWAEEEPQTTVVWRTFLPARADAQGAPSTAERKEIEKFFEAAAPHDSETLETETWRVAGWAQERAMLLADPRPAKTETGDETGGEERPAALPRRAVAAYLLEPSGEFNTRFTLLDLASKRSPGEARRFEQSLAGRVLVVDARFGGFEDGLLAVKAGTPVETADAGDKWSREARFRVLRAKEAAAPNHEWRSVVTFIADRDADGDSIDVLTVQQFRNAPQTEDGRSVSFLQTLAEHQDRAAAEICRVAGRLGLADDVTAALALAARLHDEGKRVQRWQRAFRAPPSDEIYAKTLGPIDQSLLDGYRHEFGSLRVALAHREVSALPDSLRDLMLHLVAAHHGGARPVIATRGCDDAPPSALEEQAQDVALRYARLQAHWGPWALAWWETLLRAADQRASREAPAPGGTD